jgi:hypothetical protein
MAAFAPLTSVDTSGVVAGLGGGQIRGVSTAITHRNRRRLQIHARRLASNACGFLNPPERPAQSPQREHLVSLVVVQDVAHRDVGNTRSLAAVNVSVS